MLENLDTILIGVGALLIVVSVVVNILSTARLSRLSETISRLEERVEARNAEEKNNREGSDSAFDSSILPSTELPDTDSRGTRYRPPGSRAGAKKEDSRSSGPSTRILIKKSGEKVADTVVTTPAHASEVRTKAPEAPIPEPASEAVAAFVAENGGVTASLPEPAVSSPVDEKPAVISEPAPQGFGSEEEELLKSYLGESSTRYMNVKKPAAPEAPAPAVPAAPAVSTAPAAAIDESDEDVMDVIQDTGVYPAASAVSPEFNPFDPVLQRVNLAPVRAALAQYPQGGRLVLDFKDVLFLVQDEHTDLVRLAAETGQRGVILCLRDVADGLKTELSSKIPSLTYL